LGGEKFSGRHSNLRRRRKVLLRRDLRNVGIKSQLTTKSRPKVLTSYRKLFFVFRHFRLFSAFTLARSYNEFGKFMLASCNYKFSFSHSLLCCGESAFSTAEIPFSCFKYIKRLKITFLAKCSRFILKSSVACRIYFAFALLSLALALSCYLQTKRKLK
jgi:hypothetical protein